jgi:hypothetical protein
MTNDHIKSEIQAFLAGVLPEARNRQIEAHAAACEKCRQALAKARAKQARLKREALKKASPDPMPNLFLARQGKDAGYDRPASKTPGILAAVLISAAAAYGLYRHFSVSSRSSDAADSAPVAAPVEISSSPVLSSAAVSAPAPAPLPAKLEPPPPAPSAPLPAHEALLVKQEWKGPESGIKTSRLVVIRRRGSWENLWTDMQKKEPLPTVNFDRHVIIGVFAGGRAPGVTVRLGRIRENDDEVIIPYSVSGPEVAVSSAAVTVSTAAGPAPSLSHPYLLSMIPRVDKKIRVMQTEAP